MNARLSHGRSSRKMKKRAPQLTHLQRGAGGPHQVEQRAVTKCPIPGNLFCCSSRWKNPMEPDTKERHKMKLRHRCKASLLVLAVTAGIGETILAGGNLDPKDFTTKIDNPFFPLV